MNVLKNFKKSGELNLVESASRQPEEPVAEQKNLGGNYALLSNSQYGEDQFFAG